MFVLAATADTMSPAEAAAFMSAFFGTFFLILVGFTALTVWIFWRIFVKAGFSGPLSLLCLIPSVGFLVCLIILAFSTWPNERVAMPGPASPMTPTL